MFAVTTAEFTAKGTANILVNGFIPLWGCPSTLLSDNGPQFCTRLATTVYNLLEIPHYGTNVSHVLQLPPKYAFNNSVSAATGLAPHEVHIGRLPRPPSPSLIDRTVMPIRPSTATNLPIVTSLASVNNGPTNLCENSTALTVARVNGRNSALSDALLHLPKYIAGEWVWVYNTAATIRQGLRKGADDKVLKEKLSLNWTGPFKIAVDPSSAADTPDGRPLGDKLPYLDLPSNFSGPAAKPRVIVARCKPCTNLYDADNIPRHLPAGLTQHALHAFATKSPPHHITAHDASTSPILIDVAKITGHKCVRGRGGAIAVLYGTHWNDILRPTWERELDLEAFRHLILAYWANGPDHHQPNTRQYQQLRINAAAREIARAKGERHLPGSYRLVTNDVYRTRFLSAPLPLGASIWFHSFDGSWWLGKIKQPSNVLGRYVVRFLDNSGPALIDLPAAPGFGRPRDFFRPRCPAAPGFGQPRDYCRPRCPAAPAYGQPRDFCRPHCPGAPAYGQPRDFCRPRCDASTNPATFVVSAATQPWPRSLLRSPPPSLLHSLWEQPLRGLLCRHRRLLYLHRGLLYLHRGRLCLHRGLLCLHRGLLYLHRGLLCLHRGLLCLHPSSVLCCCRSF